MKKSELIKIIKQEVNAVLFEQSATIRFGLGQKSDFKRNQQDEEFKRSIPKLTKQQLYTLISKLQTLNLRGDTDAARRLKFIMDGFPLDLKDGQVASLVDLNVQFSRPKKK